MERTCAVNCQMDGEFGANMFPCCGSGLHYAHLQCINRLYETNDNPTCPACRDTYLSTIKDMCVKNADVRPDDSDDEDDDSFDDDIIEFTAHTPAQTRSAAENEDLKQAFNAIYRLWSRGEQQRGL